MAEQRHWPAERTTYGLRVDRAADLLTQLADADNACSLRLTLHFITLHLLIVAIGWLFVSYNPAAKKAFSDSLTC